MIFLFYDDKRQQVQVLWKNGEYHVTDPPFIRTFFSFGLFSLILYVACNHMGIL